MPLKIYGCKSNSTAGNAVNVPVGFFSVSGDQLLQRKIGTAKCDTLGIWQLMGYALPARGGGPARQPGDR